MSPIKLILFGLCWAVFLFVLNSLIAGRPKQIKISMAALYFTTVALVGLFGEVFLDTAYNFFIGHPLWYYRILPIHGGYTSSFAIVTWGLYGFHLYLLHDSLASRWSITRMRHLVLLFSFEALLAEAMLTISAKLFLGKYLYYYLPADLWHVSTFQDIPFYFICGFVVLRTLQRFRKDPTFFTSMNIALLVVFVFMAK